MIREKIRAAEKRREIPSEIGESLELGSESESGRIFPFEFGEKGEGETRIDSVRTTARAK